MPGWIKLLGLVSFTLGCVLTVRGQSSGELTGIVTDPQNAVVAGAGMRLVSSQTRTEFGAVTNSEGLYRLPNLPPGTYQLMVTATGFGGVTITPVAIEVGRVTRVDVSLKVGANVDEVVTITAGAQLLDVESGTKGQIITSRQIEALPLQTRNPLALLNLTTGVSSPSGGAISNRQGSDGTGITSAYSINGGVRTGTGGFNEFVVDGVSVTNRRDGTVLALPAADALQEFRVQSGGMSAEFGHTVGGVLNYATKGGANELHGTLFENHRSTATNARRALPINTSKPGNVYNQFGGVAGGPVLIPRLYNGRDKTFFFFSFDGSRWVRKNPNTATIPTAKMRNGDFSEFAARVFDPASATTPAARTQFPNNQIPSNRFNPIGKKILDLFPLPNLPGTANNYQGVFRVFTPLDNYGVRIDHNISSKQRAFFKWTRINSISLADFVLGKVDQQTQNLNLPSSNLTFNYNYALTSRLVYNATLGYTKFQRFFLDDSGNTAGAQFFGYSVTPTPESGTLVNVRPLATFDIYRGIGTSGPQKQFAENFQINQAVTLLAGSHTFKFGADLRRYYASGFIAGGSPNGNIGFNSLQTSNGAANTGNSAASLLLGLANTFIIQQPPDLRFGLNAPAFYVSDDFKLTHRLTVNLSLRWEMESGLSELHNRAGYFDSQARNQVVGITGVFRYAGGANSRSITSGDRDNFGPRVGFAWTPAGQKTVVRGAFGVYYSPIPLVGFYAQAAGFDSTFNPIKPNATAPAVTLGSSYNVPPAAGPLGDAAFLGIGLTQPLNRDVKNPEVYQWNIGVQRELFKNTVVELLYSGNRGVHLLAFEDINRPPFELIEQAIAAQRASGAAGAAQAFLNTNITNPLAGRVPGTLGAANITRFNAAKPYPQFASTTVALNNRDSIYHSLQAKLERRLTGDLSLLLAYTLSKQIDNAQSANFNSAESSNVGNAQNPYNLGDARAVGNLDRTHLFAGNIVYALPFGKGKRWVNEGWGGRLLGGFQLTSIISIWSGQALAITQSDANGLGLGGGRPDLIGNPAGGRGANNSNGSVQWINRAAYQLVNGRFGTAPIRDPRLRGPNFYQLDLGLQRDLNFSDRFQLRFRAESFNALNQTNLGLPEQNLNSPAFGQINIVYDPRVFQFGLQFRF